MNVRIIFWRRQIQIVNCVLRKCYMFLLEALSHAAINAQKLAQSWKQQQADSNMESLIGYSNHYATELHDCRDRARRHICSTSAMGTCGKWSANGYLHVFVDHEVKAVEVKVPSLAVKFVFHSHEAIQHDLLDSILKENDVNLIRFNYVETIFL